jgi:hypothetical protein
MMRILTGAMVAASVWAGPAISCHWTAVPGTTFGELGALRDRAYQADDSAAESTAALAELAKLRAAIKPGDAMSYLRAGFWATTMHDIRVAPDSDGPVLILKALELRPNDPEFEFFAALAYLTKDKVMFVKHWNRARELAKPGSATAVNIKIVNDLYKGSIGD